MESLNEKYTYNVFSNNNKIDNKLQNPEFFIDLLNNLQKHVHTPLKEGLLLINLIEAYEEQKDKLSLINEIKNLIKSGLNNCLGILKQGFNFTRQVSIKKKIINNILDKWNDQLFVDIVILVQKIFIEKKIQASSREAILCITEIYNYCITLSNNTLDPSFAEWIIERFLNESNKFQ